MNNVTRFTDETELLTPHEAAKILRVSAGWVRDHATRRAPRLPHVRLGRLIRFRPADLTEFINRYCTGE